MKRKFDYSKAAGFISEEEVSYMSKLVADAKKQLTDKSGAGNDFLGWIDLPVDYDKEEFARVTSCQTRLPIYSRMRKAIRIQPRRSTSLIF